MNTKKYKGVKNMNNFFGYKYINGFKVDFFGYENNTLYYECNGKTRKAKQHYVCPFGGNPFAGTIIEYYIIILPNGKKKKYNIYA